MLKFKKKGKNKKMNEEIETFSIQEKDVKTKKEIAAITFNITDENIKNFYYYPTTKTICLSSYLFMKEPKTFYDIVSSIYQNTTSKTIYINYAAFFTDSWEKILNNPNITTIYYEVYDAFFLTAKRLDELKEKGKKIYVKKFTPDLFPRLNKDFFLSQTFHDPGYPYDTKIITLDNPVLKEELPYLENTKEITISYYHKENIKMILEYLKKIHYEGSIILLASDTGQNYFFVKSYQDSLNIEVKNDYLDKSSKEYLNTATKEEFFQTSENLNALIEPIKKSNLSPFEKYIFLYDLVKNYKVYKENYEDASDARSIYKILDNEYMVCSGYANLLTNLCELVNIPCQYITANLGIYQSWDNDELFLRLQNKLPAKSQKILLRFRKFFNYLQDVTTKFKLVSPKIKKSGHARCYIYLKDPKYQINGLYYSDPTWESNYDFNYTFLAFTDSENSLCNMNWFLDRMALLDSKSLEEFYEKINYLQRGQTILEILSPLLEMLKKINPELYANLQTKYSLVFNNKTLSYGYDQEINQLINELYAYFSEKTNHPISLETTIEAILNTKKFEYSFTEEELKYYQEYLQNYLPKRKNFFFYKDEETKKQNFL